MLKTELIWETTPIIYNDKKYSYEILENGHVKLFDKQTNNPIFNVYSPIFIKEIKTDEFIVVYPASDKTDYQFILQHIKYDNLPKILYQQQYTSKKSIGEISSKKDVYIMEGFLETTLYNTTTNKSITLENTEITEIKNKELKDTYLQGNMDIDVDLDEKDHLTMYIDLSILEFNGFYSELQDRFIPIIPKENHCFLENFNITLQKEVLKYIEILEEYEKSYHKKTSKKASQILSKKLTHKK